MARYADLGASSLVMFLLGVVVVHLEQLVMHKGAVAEARIEQQFEKCCSLGTSWAREGLRCEKFIGPVTGVPRVEQGLCLETVDICCVRAYHELQCEKGKADARQGLACVTSATKPRAPGRGDYHRDCCEGCKLGILTGSMSQGCSFKSFSFGIPWDPAFLECCYEASPTSTTDLTSELSSETDFESSSSSSSSPSSSSSSTSSSYSPSSSSSSPSSPDSSSPSTFPSSPSSSPSSSTSFSSSPASSSSVDSSSSSSSSSSSGSTPYSIPTPEMDDICQLMKGILCSDICVPTPGSYYCKCRDGFTLLEDEKTCRQDLPTDRCKPTNPCEHRCTDNGEAVICSCNPGYDLTDDGHSCAPRKKPKDDETEFSPLCPSGYRYNATNRVCDDLNECAEWNNPCPEADTVCVNTAGAHECVRKATAWSSPSIKPEPLDHREKARSSLATCSAGYKPANNSSRLTCVDVDECNEQLHTCDLGERCVNEIGSYRCVPNDSEVTNSSDVGDDRYDGAFLDVPNRGLSDSLANKLASRYVPNDPEVTNSSDVDDKRRSDGAFVDVPNRGSSDPPPLPANKLENCASGFTFDVKSRRCIDVDECANAGSAVCGLAERCVNMIGSYRCMPTCPPGFQPPRDNQSRADDDGTREQQPCEDINECSLGLHTCNVSTQRCLNTNGSYACEMLPTTYATSTTTAATRIASSSTTRPLLSTRYNRLLPPKNDLSTDRYWSTEPCKLGYKRDAATGYCVDIDECAVGPGCRDHERCTNTPGGYNCSSLCSAGWYFSTTTKGCQDVDECLLGRHDCPQGTHRCVNTNGSFVCELIPPCSRGFRQAFNGTCVDVDECSEALHNCRLDLHQYCVNRDGAFECLTRLPSCPVGYQYSLSTRQCDDVDECLTGQYKCDARMSERCVNLPGTYRCERPPPSRQRQRPACPSGYRYHPRLRKCTDIDECAEGLDSCGDEICYNQPGGYSCAKSPVPMTRRPISTTAMPAPANQKCVDGTRFVRNRGCVDINECKELEDACSSNEECVNTMSSYTCVCRTGFRRDNLTQACVDINECQLQENDCLPTQRCDNTIGSYTCTRFLPCGTGYTLNAATEICEDDDECVLGTHDCGPGYQCRNTLGSYRCDRVSRGSNAQPRTTTTTMRTIATTGTTTTTITSLVPVVNSRTSCPRGFEPGSGGKCVDVDECQGTPNPCGRFTCINTLGSYKCTASRVICGPGYTLDPVSGKYCIDVDECREKIHECGKGQTCENRQGGYHCVCPIGHAVGPNDDCVDIDECSIYGIGICGSNGRCENTVGSYKCVCNDGFENVGGNVAACQVRVGHSFVIPANSPSRSNYVYRCGCEAGFRLNADNRTCNDVDECTEFKDNNLCIGICENTPGSYTCKCPSGYKLSTDGRTCLDIDECASGNVCRGPNEMCQNTRGSYRCNRIDCPAGYQRDSTRKNRCVRASKYCNIDDLACLRSPSHYSYNFITFVSMLPIPSSGPLELFTMRGTHQPESTIQFTMALVDVRALPGVARATESCFALKRPIPSQVILVLTRSIPGPQEIELDLSMEVYHGSRFMGSAVAKIFIFVSQYEF